MIKFIYFDVGDVIVDNDYAKRTIANNYTLSYEKVVSFFSEHWQLACRGQITNEDYHDVLVQELGISHPSRDITTLWAESQAPIKETHALIYNLMRQYRLGILSNAEKTALEKQIKKGHIPDIGWEVIIESAGYGVIKPEPKIYEIAEALAKVSPNELFFIDDHIEMVEAAKKRGWHGEVFDPKDRNGSIKRIKKSLLMHAI